MIETPDTIALGVSSAAEPVKTVGDDWFRRNDAWLLAALAQLRARLNAAAVEPTAAPPVKSSEVTPRRGPFGLGDFIARGGSGKSFGGEPEMPLLPAPKPGATAIEAQRLAKAVAEAAEGEPPPALVALGKLLGLTTFELDLLFLCVAVELDPGLTAMMPMGGHPTFFLALQVLPDAAWEALAPDRPLRHWRLIELDRAEGRPLTASALRVDERILNFAKGLAHLDARLAPLLQPVAVIEGQLAVSQQDAVAAVAGALVAGRPPVAVLRGIDAPSKRDVAAAAAAAAGLGLHRLAADALPLQIDEIELLARLWHREALLQPLALLLDVPGQDRAAGNDATVRRFVGRSGGPMIVDTRAGAALPFHPSADVLVQRPTAVEQAEQWADALAGRANSETLARRLAGRFDLGRQAVAEIARDALVAGSGEQADDTALDRTLNRAALTYMRPDLARLAERVEVKAGIDDIVLPTVQTDQLRQLAAHVEHRVTVMNDWGFGARMNRGLGVSALFAGDSGAGKTMAAEVVANLLGLDLYRIDLSAVVSKYIGETEKNLGSLFDAAEAGGAVLLFDEADALFGKRSEVRDSHDRFANIEIDYLLQRMEAYRGLAILTTNQKGALDQAFTRRLRFIVDFPYPGPAERRRIWEKAFPATTPVEGLDLDRLARLDLTGAAIQSVALNAAYLAADRGGTVTMPLLMEAGRAEFRKLERPINEADFRPVRQAGAGMGA